jgi:hypothetical protein
MPTDYFEGNKFINPPGAVVRQTAGKVDYFGPSSPEKTQGPPKFENIKGEKFFALYKNSLVKVEVEYFPPEFHIEDIIRGGVIQAPVSENTRFSDVLELRRAMAEFKRIPDHISNRLLIRGRE